jgi:hypothetical protein
MNFVFSNWLSRQHAFFGIYERKVIEINWLNYSLKFEIFF